MMRVKKRKSMLVEKYSEYQKYYNNQKELMSGVKIKNDRVTIANTILLTWGVDVLRGGRIGAGGGVDVDSEEGQIICFI
jgi:hypothetical protein